MGYNINTRLEERYRYDFQSLKPFHPITSDVQDDPEGFNSNCHLPKGLFHPEGQTLDSQKENLVISFTEDDRTVLDITLKALDNYFKLDIDTVKQIKDRFNIFIAWSTSLEDALKVLELIKNQILDWSKVHILFLNDLHINSGTGPNFRYLGGSGNNPKGHLIQDTAQSLLNIPVSSSKQLIQTSTRSDIRSPQIESSKDPGNWLVYGEQKIQEAVETMSRDFSKYPSFVISKLASGIQLSNNIYNGVRIPIEAFVKSLSSGDL